MECGSYQRERERKRERERERERERDLCIHKSFFLGLFFSGLFFSSIPVHSTSFLSNPLRAKGHYNENNQWKWLDLCWGENKQQQQQNRRKKKTKKEMKEDRKIVILKIKNKCSYSLHSTTLESIHLGNFKPARLVPVFMQFSHLISSSGIIILPGIITPNHI